MHSSILVSEVWALVKRVVYGWPVTVYGWPVTVYGWAVVVCGWANQCAYVADFRSYCAAVLGKVVVMPVVVERCHRAEARGVSQLKVLDNFVDMPTVVLRQVPSVRIVQEPAEIPQLQFVDMPVVVQRQVASVLTVQTPLEISVADLGQGC